MADNVVQLPTAAEQALPKRRWHGSYPKGVLPISRPRIKRKSDELHRAREQAREQARSRENDMEIERRGVERLRQSLLADSWPWPGIDRRRYDQLTDSQRDELGFVFLDALRRLEERNGNE